MKMAAVTSFVLFCAFIAHALAQNPTVSITQGQVVGRTVGNYNVYYGIPYAGYTAGSRFKAPTAAPTFPTAFQATEPASTCAQPGTVGLVGSEDCLVVNVFQPTTTTTQRPVIVYIDGDDYTNTANTYPYSYTQLVQQDIVFVTLHYRVSIFGFLCLGVDEAPGNAGLKDIVAGLRWINQNIAAFGGNPSNVVLFGHGSGAAAADLVTLSPLATNLVHKVIASSGSSLAPWAVAYDPIGNARALGASLGYTGQDNAELASHLESTDIHVLIAAIRNFELATNNTGFFAPCVENSRLNGTFLPDAPINILRSGNYSHVPFITGYSDRDGTLRAQQAMHHNWLDLMQANFTNFLQADLTFPNIANKTAVADSIRNYYFQAATINQGVIEDFFDYQGDTMFVVSILRAAVERAATSTAPVRVYDFKFRGTQNTDWPFAVPLMGAQHGSVLKYLFDYDLTALDSYVSQSLIRRWAAFAHTGTPVATTGAGNVAWDQVTSTTLFALSYDGFSGLNSSEISIASPHQQRRAFWDNIYQNHYQAPRPVSSGVQILGLTVFLILSQIVVKLL